MGFLIPMNEIDQELREVVPQITLGRSGRRMSATPAQQPAALAVSQPTETTVSCT
jgi:hypothetical protein